ncbi:MAG: PcfJ domain-containing protein [Planctomycetes bacterium]|nr:PcfJ domain-containing protein [Planctomycetota bacterium]
MALVRCAAALEPAPAKLTRPRRMPPRGTRRLAALAARHPVPALVRRQLLLPFPDETDRVEDAYAAFCSAIAKEARGLILSFRSGRWELLQYLNRVGIAAFELARSTPALAWAAANAGRLCPQQPRPRRPVAEARRRVFTRQRDIATDLRLPAAETTVRLLRKLPPSACTVANFDRLRRARADPFFASLLPHLPRLTPALLRVVAHPGAAAQVTPKWLLELASADRPRGASDPVGDLCLLAALRRLRSQIGAPAPPERIRSMSHAKAIEREYVELLCVYGEYLMDEATEADVWTTAGSSPHASGSAGIGSRVVLPDEPLVGTGTLVPLRTAQETIAEGRAMHHCVGSYLYDVLGGSVYVYRLLAPERATVAVDWDGECGRWRVCEVSGPCNRPVSGETDRVVAEWLVAADVKRAGPEGAGRTCIACRTRRTRCPNGPAMMASMRAPPSTARGVR